MTYPERSGAARKDVLGSIGTERDAAILRRGSSCVSNSRPKGPALWLHRPKPVSSPAAVSLWMREANL